MQASVKWNEYCAMSAHIRGVNHLLIAWLHNPICSCLLLSLLKGSLRSYRERSYTHVCTHLNLDIGKGTFLSQTIFLMCIMSKTHQTFTNLYLLMCLFLMMRTKVAYVPRHPPIGVLTSNFLFRYVLSLKCRYLWNL